MREILERFLVERKHLRRLARPGLVAGIRAIGDKTARQRRRRAERIGRRQSKPGDQHAVEAAAAILQRAAVPLDREVYLEFDRRRLGIGRCDLAEHLAEFRIGRRDARCRRRPPFGDGEWCRRYDGGGVDPDGIIGRSDKAAARRRRIAGHLRGHRIRTKERGRSEQRGQLSPRAQIELEVLHRFPRYRLAAAFWAGCQAYNGSRHADVNRNKPHFTSEQPPSASGRNAWSAGMVETSL